MNAVFSLVLCVCECYHFYCTMLRRATASRLSVSLSVRGVEVSWSHRLEIFKNNFIRSLQTPTIRIYQIY